MDRLTMGALQERENNIGTALLSSGGKELRLFPQVFPTFAEHVCLFPHVFALSMHFYWFDHVAL